MLVVPFFIYTYFSKLSHNFVKLAVIGPEGHKIPEFSFINQNNEFTVNIALIKNHNPVLGVIYAPALSTLYYAYKNKGSHKLFMEENLDSISESIKITTLNKKKTDHLRVFESRSHSNVEFQKWVNENIKDYELIKKGNQYG